jgi:hypothetical protein
LTTPPADFSNADRRVPGEDVLLESGNDVRWDDDVPHTVAVVAGGLVGGHGLLREVGRWGVADRLLVSVTADGLVSVSASLDGELQDVVGALVELAWPLTADEFEDYLRAPFGVYEQRGPRVATRLGKLDQRMFSAVLAAEAARDAYVTVRARAAAGGVGTRPEIVVRSADPGWLGLPCSTWRSGRIPRCRRRIALAPGDVRTTQRHSTRHGDVP